ncbi:MAG: radical SAM family heme chaperone HemW [Tannerellaceae bacterium]|jgi:oxygen-independent coproporphyrinogen-3 oxidase|nr:radical SAM family heme chaperone HemW [Tannerellaceae bacterium]
MAGIYIHVPFCACKCLYCDFFSTPALRLKEAWLQAAIGEMELRRDYLGGESVATIYFGGGTPSLLAASDLERIFNAIGRLFTVDANAEVTLEANPDDMTPPYVASLRSLPVNRVSMGVQSFSDADLRFLGRRHDSRRARQAIAACLLHGFDNISIDLIYALPGQTLRQWEANLAEAAGMALPHISAYHLSYEADTRLYAMLEAGQVQPAGEDDSADMFNLLSDRLVEAGYEHYEISSFALGGRVSRHNSSYWEGRKYLGIGPSAHSFNIESREWNISSIAEYIKGISRGAPVVEREAPHPYNEYIMTGLRTSRGIETAYISDRFGRESLEFCLKESEKYIKAGILEDKGDRLSLSRRGMLVSDAVIRSLFRVDSYTK